MVGRLNNEEIDALLRRLTIGRIACTDGNQPYIVPLHYVYDGYYIIAHSMPGMKIDIMRKNPMVSFLVDEIITPGRWQSVLIQGQFQELTGQRERHEAMKVFLDHTFKLKISETARLPEQSAQRLHPKPDEPVKSIFYRILIAAKSGRFEYAASER
jgi:uncharacterized protein